MEWVSCHLRVHRAPAADCVAGASGRPSIPSTLSQPALLDGAPQRPAGRVVVRGIVPGEAWIRCAYLGGRAPGPPESRRRLKVTFVPRALRSHSGPRIRRFATAQMPGATPSASIHRPGFQTLTPQPRGSKYKSAKGITSVVCSGFPSLATIFSITCKHFSITGCPILSQFRFF